MPSFRLTQRPSAILRPHIFYGFHKFGKSQAEAYAEGLKICFQLLSEQPRIGQTRPGKGEELRVFFHRSHVIGYRITDSDILIQRVLDVRRNWQKMLRAE